MRGLCGSFGKIIMIACCAILTTACASHAQQLTDPYNDYGAEINDPFEGLNRAVFSFNEGFDTVIGNPVARAYRTVAPQPVRTGVNNFLTNLRMPINIANNILQGNISGAFQGTTRLVVNTFVGLGGVFDVAGAEGIPYHHGDFGQTMGVWGIGHGAYLVLPIIGPSSVRDATGMAVDTYFDPVRMYLFNTDREWLHYTRVGMSYVSIRENLMDALEDLQRHSFDYYAAMRSAYVQRRQSLVDPRFAYEQAYPTIPDYDDY